MSTKSQNERIIFGLKVKQLRKERSLSFKELAEQTSMSVSYLNEIEKGKKYPREDKIDLLANVLGVSKEELVSLKLSRGLAPVGELLSSNFLNELPLDLFGIELSKVVEIIASAPLRVGAFISTLVELARNYALGEENFYNGALRSYQEMHNNYFEDIEDAASKFVARYDLPTTGPVSTDTLKSILEKQFKYKVAEDGLKDFPDLQSLRSVYDPEKKKLFMNGSLNSHQRAFQFGKEIGFNYLKLKDRSNTSSLLRIDSFEKVLNHYKAAYFSVAILINRDHFVKDLRQFFRNTRWDGEAFLGLMRKYDASPEMLFHRLTNVIPRFFGLNKMFFLRFMHDTESNRFQIDKELHLTKRHHPHGNNINEHYCRRWLSLSLLQDLRQMQKEGKYIGTIVGAQRSRYFGTEDEYLCFTLARPAAPSPNLNMSVTLGLVIDDELRQAIGFLNDPSIVTREVNTTCERCPIQDCNERALPALVIEKRAQRKRIQESLNQIIHPS